jgi:hypothetical protein
MNNDNIGNARPLMAMPDMVDNVDVLGEIPVGLFHPGARARIEAAQPLGGLDGNLNENDIARLPDIYHGPKAMNYWVPSNDSSPSSYGWVDGGKDIATNLLRMSGFSAKAQEGEALSAAQLAITHIVQNRHVIYAGALAGYKKGLVETKCGKMLVTTEAKLMEAVEGEWGMLEGFLLDLFGMHVDRFYGWMKIGYERMLHSNNAPCQPFIVTGRPGGGKSLLLDFICDVYGGRQADPYKYAMGETQFNIELFQAECLIIDDKAARGDHTARRALGQFLKQCAALRTHYAHAKGVTGANLSPIWRVMMACNNNDDSVGVLPHLDESMIDKLLVLDAGKGHDFAQDDIPVTEYISTLRSQLPAFLYFLCNVYDVLPEMSDTRHGVKGFIAPEVDEKISDLDPETTLWEVMQDVQRNTFKGEAIALSPAEWSKLLESEFEWGPVVKKILVSHTSLGIYLSRLASKYPTKLYKHRTSAKRLFVLHNASREPHEGTGIG